MEPLHHAGLFYLKPKVFLHDFTLIASVVGESVYIPAKIARLAKC